MYKVNDNGFNKPAVLSEAELIYPLFCFFSSVHKRVKPIRSLLP